MVLDEVEDPGLPQVEERWGGLLGGLNCHGEAKTRARARARARDWESEGGDPGCKVEGSVGEQLMAGIAGGGGSCR